MRWQEILQINISTTRSLLITCEPHTQAMDRRALKENQDEYAGSLDGPVESLLLLSLSPTYGVERNLDMCNEAYDVGLRYLDNISQPDVANMCVPKHVMIALLYNTYVGHEPTELLLGLLYCNSENTVLGMSMLQRAALRGNRLATRCLVYFYTYIESSSLESSYWTRRLNYHTEVSKRAVYTSTRIEKLRATTSA
jgi:hypothetical protein